MAIFPALQKLTHMLSSCVCFGKTDYELPLFVGLYKSKSNKIWREIVNNGRLV